jgi:hypothetical protein
MAEFERRQGCDLAKIDVGVNRVTLYCAHHGEGDPEDALNCNTDEECLSCLRPMMIIRSTNISLLPSIKNRNDQNQEGTLIDIYKKLRPGSPLMATALKV